MAYTLQAIVGYVNQMEKVQPDDLKTIPLSAGMAIWPIDSLFREKHDVPFLPFTDEGLLRVPPTIAAIATALPRCAYLEAEFFGGVGTQASVLFDHGEQVGEIVVGASAFNETIRALGVEPTDGKDEFDTVGLGAERNTDDWVVHSADQGDVGGRLQPHRSLNLDARSRTMPDLEMTIPKLRRDAVWEAIFIVMVVLLCIIGILNLLNNIAIIPSLIWLIMTTGIVWSRCRKAGGVRRYLEDRAAVFGGRKFVLHPSGQVEAPRIRFGYELFGRRLFQRDVLIQKIESVEWSSGQATHMAGRDMKDWSVALWFDHGDPEKSKKNHRRPKPDQDIYIVGPFRREEDTSALGLEFVDFLRQAGAHLRKGDADNVYARLEPGVESENKEHLTPNALAE